MQPWYVDEQLIVDPTEFVCLYEENRPFFNIERIKTGSIPKIIDDNYVTCCGYKFNVKSTIFENANSKELCEGWSMVISPDKYQEIYECYLELEIHNYSQILYGNSAYFFPMLDLLKFCYWFYRCSKISKSDSKLLQAKKEILGKAKVLNQYSRSSQSIDTYEDLLNSTSDSYSEMMFAVLSHHTGYQVFLNKKNDFVINSNIAEVKSIHDKFDTNLLDQDSGRILRMSISNGFGMKELRDIFSEQLLRVKWLCHLKKAIKKQGAKIILFNATQSQGLRPVVIFIEENNLRKTFNHMLERAFSFTSHVDDIPVLVLLESISIQHIITPIVLLAPVVGMNENRELHYSRFSPEYVRNNIFL